MSLPALAWTATLLILLGQQSSASAQDTGHGPGSEDLRRRVLGSGRAVPLVSEEAVDAPDYPWETAFHAVLGSSLAIQVIRFTPGYPAADLLWHRLHAKIQRNTNVPLVEWNLADKGGIDALLSEDTTSRGNFLGRGYVILAEEPGAEGWTRLLSVPIWYTRSYYIVVLDSRDHDLCVGKESLAGNFSRALWRKHSVGAAGVILARCPWRLHLYSPYRVDAESAEGPRVSFTASNVTEASAVIQRLFRNFNGEPWNIAVLPSAPTMVTKPEDEKAAAGGAERRRSFDGVDGWFMDTAASYFNFFPAIIFPTDNETHGYSADGKTGTGTLGMVMSGAADISFNGRFVKNYNTNAIEFSYPYTFDELCVIVPRAGRVPSFITFFRCFQPSVWCALLLLHAAAAVALQWTHRVHAAPRPRLHPRLRYHVSERPRPATAVFTALVLLTFGSTTGSPNKRIKETSVTLVFTLGLLFNVVFMGAFQGLLFKSLTSPQFYPEIDTLLALADSGQVITTHSRSLKDTFAFDTPEMQRLSANFHVINRGVKRTGREQSGGALVRRNTAYMAEENRGKHLMGECPRKYLLAYIVQRGFPSLLELDQLLLRCAAAGLVDFWQRKSYAAKPRPRERGEQRLGTDEVQAAFFVLLVGLLASCGALVAERVREGLI